MRLSGFERLLQLVGINKPIAVELTVGEHHGHMVGVGGTQISIGVDVDHSPAHPQILAGPSHHVSRLVTQCAVNTGEEEDPRGQGQLLAGATTLDTGALEQLAMLLLGHALASLLDDRAHFVPFGISE